MRRIRLLAAVLGLGMIAGCGGRTLHEDAGLKTHFGHYDAAFVLRSLRNGTEIRYGGRAVISEYRPARHSRSRIRWPR